MNYFYDCEFHEDGQTIDFISIGVVADDGREFYAVSSEFDTRRVAQNEWLMDNVMSSIEHQKFVVSDFHGKPFVRDIYVTDEDAMPVWLIAQELQAFIGNDPEPKLWAWYGAYDHVCLAQIWGRMIDLPDNIPMWTNDLKTLVQLAGNPELPKQPAGNHNALADARWNVVRYNYLMELLTRSQKNGMV